MGEAKKITVYLYHGDDFDSTVYQFTDTIPVHIYNGELQINIAELLK